MEKINRKFNSKRFTFVAIAMLVLAVMGITAVFKGMEGVGSTVAIAMGGIITWYLEKETKRPSKAVDEDN